MDTLTKLVEILSTGGPWAIVALLVTALTWLAKLYIQARDNIEKELKSMAKEHAGLLTDIVRMGEKQIASGDNLAKEFERLVNELKDRKGS